MGSGSQNEAVGMTNRSSEAYRVGREEGLPIPRLKIRLMSRRTESIP